MPVVVPRMSGHVHPRGQFGPPRLERSSPERDAAGTGPRILHPGRLVKRSRHESPRVGRRGLDRRRLQLEPGRETSRLDRSTLGPKCDDQDSGATAVDRDAAAGDRLVTPCDRGGDASKCGAASRARGTTPSNRRATLGTSGAASPKPRTTCVGVRAPPAGPDGRRPVGEAAPPTSAGQPAMPASRPLTRARRFAMQTRRSPTAAHRPSKHA
jgi:hypothetical protein